MLHWKALQTQKNYVKKMKMGMEKTFFFIVGVILKENISHILKIDFLRHSYVAQLNFNGKK